MCWRRWVNSSCQVMLRSWLQHSLAFAWSTAWVPTGAVFARRSSCSPPTTASIKTPVSTYWCCTSRLIQRPPAIFCRLTWTAMVGANFIIGENITRSVLFSAWGFWYRAWKIEGPLKGGSRLGETLRNVCVLLDDFEDDDHESKQVPWQSTGAAYCRYWVMSLIQIMK